MGSEVRIATIPYGTVIVDYDGETMMSLGYVTDGAAEYLACLRLRMSADYVDSRFDMRPVVIEMISWSDSTGTVRYAVQEDTLPWEKKEWNLP